MDAVIITGMSGAGKSLALNYFEDMGYYCMENLPPQFISDFIELMNSSMKSIDKLAIVIDVRATFFEDLYSSVVNLKKMECNTEVLFLDASTEVLINRYKELRRPHPINPSGMLSDSIELERKMLEDIKKKADIIIDTSKLSSQSFRKKLNSIFSNGNKRGMEINVQSFGFKNGILLEADLVFDVRFLPNPHYIEDLRPLSGLDNEIKNFVFSYDETTEFMEKIIELLKFLIPKYKEEGKSSLVIGVGCTGGKHRSVCISEAIYEELSKSYKDINISHRDKKLW